MSQVNTGKPATVSGEAVKSVPVGTAPVIAENVEDYSKFVPTNTDQIRVVGKNVVNQVWNRVYEAVGLPAGSEDDKKAIRCACYTYFCINGTVNKKDYSGASTASTGRQVEGARVATVVGAMQLRRFFRGNDVESYNYLKRSGVVNTTQFDRFASRVAQAGIPRDMAWATADWLDECSLMTVAEQAVNTLWRQFRFEKADAARGGKSVEEQQAETLLETAHVGTSSNKAKAVEGTKIW